MPFEIRKLSRFEWYFLAPFCKSICKKGQSLSMRFVSFSEEELCPYNKPYMTLFQM